MKIKSKEHIHLINLVKCRINSMALCVPAALKGKLLRMLIKYECIGSFCVQDRNRLCDETFALNPFCTFIRSHTFTNLFSHNMLRLIKYELIKLIYCHGNETFFSFSLQNKNMRKIVSFKILFLCRSLLISRTKIQSLFTQIFSSAADAVVVGICWNSFPLF
jgi:hypothetical protein